MSEISGRVLLNMNPEGKRMTVLDITALRKMSYLHTFVCCFPFDNSLKQTLPENG